MEGKGGTSHVTNGVSAEDRAPINVNVALGHHGNSSHADGDKITACDRPTGNAKVGYYSGGNFRHYGPGSHTKGGAAERRATINRAPTGGYLYSVKGNVAPTDGGIPRSRSAVHNRPSDGREIHYDPISVVGAHCIGGRTENRITVHNAVGLGVGGHRLMNVDEGVRANITTHGNKNGSNDDDGDGA